MPETNGIGGSEAESGPSDQSLLQACLTRFDALIATGDVCFDAGTTTIVPVSDSFKVSFRLCPTLLSKPVIVSSPSTSSFPDPLAPKPRNPFENPEPHFIVECPILARPGVVPTHRLMVNKFPVYRPQLLVTTIAVKSQADDLDIEDVRAGLDVLTELERASVRHEGIGEPSEFMGIYNCGAHSGNSQPHKHLQIFPKPKPDEIVLFPELKASSIEKWRSLDSVYSHRDVPFVHFVAYFAAEAICSPHSHSGAGATDATMLLTYYKLLDHTKRALAHAGVEGRPSYNVIFNRQWMLVVPRRAACGAGTGAFFQGPQVNAAGMAGLVWMSNAREFEEWKRRGVGTHLGECGLRWEEMEGTQLGL